MTFLLVARQSYHCSVKRPKSTRLRHPAALSAVRGRIILCERCPRLRDYCRAVARDKRAAYRSWTYWGRPVPGFGDPDARVLILGLAPAAHGANRTGRVFTGDGAGGSGDFLMAALHRAGFANQATSERRDDGLRLTGAYIAAAVRCAPPGNKPAPAEIAACLDHLEAEVAALPQVDTVLALGRIAWEAWWQLLGRHVPLPRPRPAFGHGATVDLRALGAGHRVATLVGCYHPSRQNTNTGTVTAAMYDAIFQTLPGALDASAHVRGVGPSMPDTR
ncbi:MAG: uracil-DNA glycosylase [Acidobacteria bacterium]|nr:uracil-DNA glycosylase [Acidobacteriota bacterium]